MLVFDSSTLILIAKIELLDVFLKDIGMEIAIPKAVEDECCGGKKTLDALIDSQGSGRVQNQGEERKEQKTGRETGRRLQHGQGRIRSHCPGARKKRRCWWASTTRTESMPANWPEFRSPRRLGILVRSRQKGLIDRSDALVKLSALAKYGWYRNAILEDAKLRLEEQP